MDDLHTSKPSKHLSLPVLAGPENYDYWSKATRRWFAYEELDTWILPTWRKSSGLSEIQDVSLLTGDARKKFNKVLLYLTLHVAPTLLHMVDSAKTPYEAWSALSEAFQSSGATGEFKVVKRMDALSFPTDSTSMMENVQSFIAERSQICSEAASIGLNFGNLTPEQCVRLDIMRFLNKLPHDEFRNFIDRISSGLTTQFTTVESVVQELRSWSMTSFEIRGQGVTALNASHTAAQSPRFCSTCQKANRPSNTHNDDRCFWTHPDIRPPGWTSAPRRNSRQANAATQQTTQPSSSSTHAAYTVYQCMAEIVPDSTHSIYDDPPDWNLMASIEPDVIEFGRSYGEICAEHANLSTSISPVFLMDSGASSHLTNLRDNVFHSRPSDVKVSFADGVTRRVELVGELHFSMIIGNIQTTIKLTRVFYAPWCRNIVLVGQLVNEAGLRGSISKEDGMILTGHGKNLFHGTHYGKNLYSLRYDHLKRTGDSSYNPDTLPFVAAAALEPADKERVFKAIDVHMAFAHVSYDRLL